MAKVGRKIMNWIKAKINGTSKAASMTEYILVVVLVAVAAIGILRVFGKQVRAVYCTAASKLGGNYEQCMQAAGSGAQLQGMQDATGDQNNSPF